MAGIYDDFNDALGRDTGLRTIVNAGRQAVGDTSYRQRMQPDVPEADAAAYRKMGGLQPSVPTPAPAALPTPAPERRPDDITGSAARIQAANPRGQYAVPQMARNLVAESQQRFAPQGSEGSIGVDGYMRQLQNIRALSDMIPQGGYAILGDPNEGLNAERTMRWAAEDRDRQFRNTLGGSGADARARMGAMSSYMNAQTGADTSRQNAMLGFQGGRERDANQLALEGMRNQTQFGLEGMRGKNQLATEGMRQQGAFELEKQRAGSARELEAMRRAGRLEELGMQGENAYGLQESRFAHEANDPYKTAMGGFYGAQTRKLEDEIAYGKTPSAIIQKHMEVLTKGGMDPKEALPVALKLALGAQREQKAAGGVVGYEDGGQVRPMSAAEKLLADMDAKYGKTAGSAPAPAPQPAPAPRPVQQPQGFFGRAGSALGGYGRPDPNRMPVEARADGGQVGGEMNIDQMKAKIAAFEKAGQAYTDGMRNNTRGAGLPTGVPGYVSYEPGGVQRRNIGGIDHILDPNAPGGANFQQAGPTGLAASGGYGTYSGSGQSRGVTPWDQTPGGQAPQAQLGETALMGSAWYNKPTGLAFGGAVPAQDVPGGRAVAQAVAGRQVFGQSDGSGRDDALPAVIDGERPAALTSGEFVWPVHAVKYFGMAKLNKMLAEAEKGMAPQDEPA